MDPNGRYSFDEYNIAQDDNFFFQDAFANALSGMGSMSDSTAAHQVVDNNTASSGFTFNNDYLPNTTTSPSQHKMTTVIDDNEFDFDRWEPWNLEMKSSDFDLGHASLDQNATTSEPLQTDFCAPVVQNVPFDLASGVNMPASFGAQLTGSDTYSPFQSFQSQ